MSKRTYDSTVARIAGNLLGGAAADWMGGSRVWAVMAAVETARAIVAETQRTEPPPADAAVDPHVADTGTLPSARDKELRLDNELRIFGKE